MKNKQYKRSGDHYFHEIESEIVGQEVKHTGSFVFGVGEASNHNHVITVEKPKDLKIVQDEKGNYYFELFADGVLTHVVGDSGHIADHKPITIKKGKYKHVHEREVDLFSKVVRQVID